MEDLDLWPVPPPDILLELAEHFRVRFEGKDLSPLANLSRKDTGHKAYVCPNVHHRLTLTGQAPQHFADREVVHSAHVNIGADEFARLDSQPVTPRGLHLAALRAHSYFSQTCAKENVRPQHKTRIQRSSHDV